MSHSIEGLIVAESALSADGESADVRSSPRPGGLAFADVRPLTEPGETSIDGLRGLTPGVARFAARLSRQHPVAYVETDYYGGAGGQAAVVWDREEIVYGPTRTDDQTPVQSGAINQALRLLGVRAADGVDEFDTIGLGTVRATDDFFT